MPCFPLCARGGRRAFLFRLECGVGTMNQNLKIGLRANGTLKRNSRNRDRIERRTLLEPSRNRFHRPAKMRFRPRHDTAHQPIPDCKIDAVTVPPVELFVRRHAATGHVEMLAI